MVKQINLQINTPHGSEKLSEITF